ncbi:MAG: hypothetical protein C0483_04545 [Pirellula sp.]|nr:hypothetical protein [Pirellula sp.]
MPQANAFLNDSCLPRHDRTGHFTNRELTTIAVLAALHFAVSFASRMVGGVLYVFLGPWSTFVDGIGGEGIPCLLLAVTVALVPRVGTATYAILTVWLLNAIVSGTFSVTSIVQVSVSVVMHESILALSGVTLGRRRRATESYASHWPSAWLTPPCFTRSSSLRSSCTTCSFQCHSCIKCRSSPASATA